MVREITIGQYYDEESVIHRLDPRVKLVATLVYIISIFVVNTYIGYIFVALFLGVCVALSKVPVKYIVKGLRPVMIILLITILFNMLLTPGEILWKFGIFRISKEGLKAGATMALRLTLLITGSSLMTLTTTPNNLTDAMERLLRPLSKIKVPVHEIAMMMSIALRFIPILLEETDIIMKAQMARGADFESGNIIKRAKALVPLLVPLFVSAFRRANDLAMAMEARCYRGGEGRTKMKPLKYVSRDYIAYAIVWLYLAGCIAMRIFM
ncbi:energy-coupling factor transport system permease protein [Lachnospiraceae bacterium XBB2008]|nr:energy-coupling factor transporter transmembrane protein EcfT [Lachnospiraceae bacterium]SCX86973.1 energy-coupling factor transport system permease protein [Lachnospiraceae bacterium XBB2008]